MTSGQYRLKAAGVAALAAAIPLLLLGCGGKPSNSNAEWPADHSGPKVVVSFAPLYCFAANVAGEDAVVRNVMTTTGPHDFNPTTDEVRILTKADVFFVVGLNLDDGKAELMKKGANNDRLKLVKLGDSVPKDKLREGHCTHAEHAHDHEHEADPHVWLSPDYAVYLVHAIRDELKAADPAHATDYERRAADYVTKLRGLKAHGEALLKGKKDNRIISFHDSLAYFAETFGVEVRDVVTAKPGQEPDAKHLAKLIRVCTDENKPTRVIVVEPQYSNSNAGESLRKELVAKGVSDPVLVEFDTLETVKPDDLKPDWYENKMRANLEALAKAMR